MPKKTDQNISQQTYIQDLFYKIDKGFDVSNLTNIRHFYLGLPIQETMSLKLNWIYYYFYSLINSQTQQKNKDSEE